jgi:hypothetical protein
VQLIEQSVNRIQWALQEILPGEMEHAQNVPPQSKVLGIDRRMSRNRRARARNRQTENHIYRDKRYAICALLPLLQGTSRRDRSIDPINPSIRGA